MNRKRHTAFIGLGANLGHPLEQCRRALEKIGKISQTELIRSSSVYQTEPLVSEGQDPLTVPWYMNAVCEVLTGLTPKKLLTELLDIEKEMGRERRKKWESRLIDLDLLFFDSLVFETKTLKIPHPEIQNRSFVLLPLKEIAPQWVHPLFKKTIEELAMGFKDSSGVERIWA